MRRRAKLAVALVLALLVHGLLIWRPRAMQVPAPPPTAGEPGDEAIAVGWSRQTESPAAAVPAISPTTEPATAGGSSPSARPTSSSSSQGGAGPAPRDYADRIRRHLSRFAGDLPGTEAGEARVRFTVGIDGEVSQIELLRSSGDPRLDEAALALPEQSAPLPSPGATPVRLEVPVRASTAP